MRVIEQKMLNAIRNKENFSQSNTEVKFNDKGDYSVYLFRNKIAQTINGELWVTWANWATPTTRNRLNALAGDKHSFNVKKEEPYINGERVGYTEWVKLA